MDRALSHYYFHIPTGTGHLYIFHHPSEMEILRESGTDVTPPSYEDAQQEIAQNSGVASEWKIVGNKSA